VSRNEDSIHREKQHYCQGEAVNTTRAKERISRETGLSVFFPTAKLEVVSRLRR
jgi:hypothetical protein